MNGLGVGVGVEVGMQTLPCKKTFRFGVIEIVAQNFELLEFPS